MKKRAILIAGPTASGKSSLALRLAEAVNGIIINADALQVYDNWRVLTARPAENDLALAPHFLYGHVHKNARYSVGKWIKEVSHILDSEGKIPIIVGGTGLYFTALTTGLSDIPHIPPAIRSRGDKMRLSHGAELFREDLKLRDPQTLATLDENNPARLQRAWEVLETTGKGLHYWHARPARALLPLEETVPISLNWNRSDLNQRIDTRFDRMMETGAVEECAQARAEGFAPDLPANRAIGAAQIIDAIDGKTTMQDAVIKSKILTHQFAKRQRNWFRNKMQDWQQIDMSSKPDLIMHTREIAEAAS